MMQPPPPPCAPLFPPDLLTRKRMAVEGILGAYTAPILADYRYELPMEYQKYAFTDKAATGMAQVAAGSLGHAQAYDRPFEPFTEEHIRHAFNLGDEALPPRSPLRASTEIPRPEKRIFSTTIVPPEDLSPPTAKKAKRPLPPGPLPPSSTNKAARPSLPDKKGGPHGGSIKTPTPPRSKQQQKQPAPPTVPAAPAPPPPPPAVPVAVLESLPALDTSKLVHQRRLIDLTPDEVETITADILRKLKNKKCKGWDKRNPLDVDINRQNCVKMGIPNYFDVVQEPMNLVLMQKKVKGLEYQSLYDFRADVDLMVHNATTFNPPGEPVHQFALDVRKLFESQWQSAVLEYDVLDDRPYTNPFDPPPPANAADEPKQAAAAGGGASSSGT